ncbi:MAG: Ca-activated chloride channel family protein [Granulosicoccus sp.]|jgi:Ca-activated chloride channel family protein
MKSTLSFFAIILICNCIVMTSCQNGIPKYSQDRTSNTKQKNQAPIDDQYAYQEEAITMIRDVTPPPPPPPIVEEVIENNKLIFEDQIMPDNQEAEMDEEDIAEEPPINFERHLNTEEYNHIVENEFLSSLEKPLSTFSIDVDNASYSNARRYLNNNQMPPKDAVRIEEFVNYFNYDYPQPKGVDPFSINTEISDCPWNQDHKLVHIGLQGKVLSKAEMPASNLVFLLDVSGSMGDYNKLPLLKKAFQLLTQQLREDDRVSIVVYAGASGLVLPPTAENNKHTIMEALERLNAGGSTAGTAGIQLAYQTAESTFIKNGNNRIILATDGDFNVGTSSTSELVRLIEKKRKSGVSLSILGFGMGNYKDGRMEQLADNGNGNYAYIDNFEEAKKVFVQEMGGTLHTIAKDVKLQIEFNPAHVKEYRLVGYENRKLKNEDFNNDKKDAGDLGAGHTVTAIYEIIPTGAETTSANKVDALKYQNRSVKRWAKVDPDWMTIKLRYKKPNEDVSKLLEVTAKDNGISLQATSNNFRYSAAVASFAMTLRDSKFKGNATYDNISEMAQGALGKDEHGYRKEFLDLIQKAKQADVRLTAEK